MSDQEINAAMLRLRIMAGAMCGSLLVYALVGILIVNVVPMGPPLIDGDTAMLLGAAFMVASVGVFGASFPLRNVIMARNALQAPTLNTLARTTMILMAMGEFGGVLGLVHALLSHSLDWLIALLACSFVTCFVHFPRRSLLERMDNH